MEFGAKFKTFLRENTKVFLGVKIAFSLLAKAFKCEEINLKPFTTKNRIVEI